MLVLAAALCLCLALAPPPAAADLESARARWQELVRLEAQVLAPVHYERAEREMSLLEAAARREGADLSKPQADAEKQLDVLEDKVTLARNVMREALAARQRAVEARAENILVAASRKLERDRREAALPQVAEAVPVYEEARLETARFALVGAARQTLAAAQQLGASQFVPRSYARALDELNCAEKLAADGIPGSGSG